MSEESVSPLGEALRRRREELGISLDQAQADTRIRGRYLKALEAEDYAALPDPVVGRGFLRNYATYLGLDAQEAARLYANQVAAPEPLTVASDEPNPFAEGRFEPVALHKMPGRHSRWLWTAPVLVLVLATLALLAWWNYPRLAFLWSFYFVKSTPTPVVQGADLTAQAAETATSTPTPTQMPQPTTAMPQTPTLSPSPSPTLTSSPSPTPTAPVYTGIFLELEFVDRSWIRVTVDGVRDFQGELPAGTYRSWYAQQRLELSIGNAGAVQVTMNGQKLGTLGALGEVVDRVFEKVGDQVGAATLTPGPSPTNTPRPTLTPTPTVGAATPVASSTP